MKNILTILIISTLLLIGCGGGEVVTVVVDEPDALTTPVVIEAEPVTRIVAGDGTLMSETELIEYFANRYIIDEGLDPGHPDSCTIWWMVYDYILHTQLAHDDFVFMLVEVYEDDDIDIPDYIDNEPPC